MKRLIPAALLLLGAGLMLPGLTLANPSAIESAPVTADLSAGEWQALRAQIEREHYRLAPSAADGGALLGMHPESKLALRFDREGFTVRPQRDHDLWTLRLRTDRVAREGQDGVMVPVEPKTDASATEVSFVHAHFTEWYRNGAAGVEHGYTLRDRPSGDGALRIGIDVAGLAAAKVGVDEAVLLRDADGRDRLRYDKLIVTDARGRTLDAQLLAPDASHIELSFDDRDAVYPVTVDPLITSLEARLTIPGDGSNRLHLGAAVALEGDTLVVGRPESRDPGRMGNYGTVLVFVRSGGVWSRQAKLRCPGSCRLFGVSVALSGDTLVVGDPEHFDPANSGQGAAFVFLRSGTSWTLQATLSAASSSALGHSVAISGDTLVAGAPYERVGVLDEHGSAYVFTRTGGTWTQQARLFPADGQTRSWFGSSVAVYGNAALVGAPLHDVGANVDQGAAYVFGRSGSTWVQAQRLIAPQGRVQGAFGNAVALFDDTAAIGERFPGSTTGQAHVFRREAIVNGTQWVHKVQLVDPSAERSAFGAAVAITGHETVTGTVIDRVVVGAPGYGFFAEPLLSGRAYVFVPSGAGWAFQARLNSAGPASLDALGAAVATSGNTVVAGAPAEDVDGRESDGSAEVFVRSGTTWTAQQQLTHPADATDDRLGYAVALSGDTLLVGALGDDIGGNDSQGSAYVFVRDTAGWTLQARLFAPLGAAFDHFGWSVALSGDTAVIGAPRFDSSGRAYVFTRSAGHWTLAANLGPPAAQAGSNFGWSVAIDGNTVVVGMRNADTVEPSTGAAFVYVPVNGTWGPQATLVAPDADSGDRFGLGVAISGNTVAIGAEGADFGSTFGPGAVFVFVRNNATWTLQQKLGATGGLANDSLGNAIALSGDTLAAGAPGRTVGGDFARGSVVVFLRSGSNWTQQARLLDDQGVGQEVFGSALALQGDLLLAGASEAGAFGLPGVVSIDEGAATLFRRSGTVWQRQARLQASTPMREAHFGSAVAISGGRIAVGAPLEVTEAGSSAGAVYVSRLDTDFGDALGSGYPTRLATDGASHLIDSGGPRLGTFIDGEPDGQPNSGATGDDIGGVDDEDGVAFGAVHVGRTDNVVNVSVSAPAGAALLDAWVDFNRDGDWGDIGEQVLDDYIATHGANAITFSAPTTSLTGTTVARFRLSSGGVAGAGGIAVDGEIEDLQVDVRSPIGPQVQFSLRSSYAFETTARKRVTLRLPALTRSTVPITVPLLVGGTAIPGIDYQPLPSSVTIPPNATQVSLDVVPINDDLDEAKETIVIDLGAPTNARLGSRTRHTLTLYGAD